MTNSRISGPLLVGLVMVAVFAAAAVVGFVVSRGDPEPATVRLEGPAAVTTTLRDAVPLPDVTVLAADGAPIDPPPPIAWTVEPSSVAVVVDGYLVPTALGGARVDARVREAHAGFTVVVRERERGPGGPGESVDGRAAVDPNKVRMAVIDREMEESAGIGGAVAAAPNDVPAPAPSASEGAGVSNPAITAVIKRNMNQVRYCYQRELTRKPDLGGRFELRFVIAKDGSVSEAETVSTTLNDAAVESCVEGRFRHFQFPEQPDGPVTVTWPFVFSPA